MKETTVRTATGEETVYCGEQSCLLRERTGSLGIVEARTDSGPGRVCSSWKIPGDGPEAQACRKELELLLEPFLFGDPEETIKGREELVRLCFARREAGGPQPHRYRVRLDTDRYSYLTHMRQYRSGLFLVDFFCYRRDRLDRHLKRAANGIRFTDTCGGERFVLPDGGRIRLTYPDGHARDEICRYIDPYHMEVGPGPMNLFSARGFAEMAEADGITVRPLDRMRAG